MQSIPSFQRKGKVTIVCIVMFLQSIAASSTSLNLAFQIILFGN